jgi:hypothetical protein
MTKAIAKSAINRRFIQRANHSLANLASSAQRFDFLAADGLAHFRDNAEIDFEPSIRFRSIEMPKPTSLQEISKLREQLSKLKDEAVVELTARVAQIRAELKDIDGQLESLTGKPATRKGRATPAMRSITMQDLKDLLASSPYQTVNIRKAGLDTTNIRTLANLHPKEIQLGGKGAWPTVGLLK